MNKLTRTMLFLAVIGATFILPGFAVADENLVLEEVTVTATKRVKSLQDVSVSVSVVSGMYVDNQAITSMEEVAFSMPSVTIAETLSGDSIFIRGVGSGVNQGFEQSVGTFIDDVYFGRGRSMRNPFLDVERIEVLKGPQGTLFGKNTIAGAISITTRKPGDETGGYVDVSWDPQYNTQSVTGAMDIPISDGLGLRLVGRYKQSDGYMVDTRTSRDDYAANENWVIRSTLLWDASDALTATWKLEASEYNRDGLNAGPVSNNTLAAFPLTLGTFIKFFDPNAETNFDYKTSSNVDPRFQEFANTETFHTALTLDYTLDNGIALKSISAMSSYEVDDVTDVDYINMGLIQQVKDQEWDFWSQEFRLSSPEDGDLSYILGLFYAEEELYTRNGSDLLGSSLGFPDTRRVNQFNQDTKTLAVFAEVTWNISDEFRAVGGLRYTRDKKAADKSQIFADIFSYVEDPAVSAFWNAVGIIGFSHSFEGLSRKDEVVTPQLKLEWDMTDDIMTYLSYSEGFKAGGFDEDNAKGDLDAEEFDSESVQSFELGSKIRLLDGRMNLNIALFNNDFDDLQVSTFDGRSSFLVGNAARARSRGVELESNMVVTENLLMGAQLSYLDAKYLEYDEGPAMTRDLDPSDAVFATGTCSDTGTVASMTCDLGGAPLQFAPKWSANLFADYSVMISNDLEIDSRIEINYSDDYQVATDQDPVLKQGSFTKVNLRIGLASLNNGWSVAVIGKNLTDKKTSNWGNDLTLTGAVFGNNYYKYIDAPRTITLQARYAF